MSKAILKKTLIGALVTIATGAAIAGTQTLTVNGTLGQWKSWNASSKSGNTPYANAVAGIDLFQGLNLNDVAGYGPYLSIPVQGTITYDDTTGAISALTLEQIGSATGYYDTDGDLDKLLDDPVTFSDLTWTYNAGSAYMSQNTGTATGCSSSSPYCVFTTAGVNANDHQNGSDHSVFDFQGINSGFKTFPQSNVSNTGYGAVAKVWTAVPGAIGVVNLNYCSLGLEVASRNNSGAVATNAANQAVFSLNIQGCIPALDTDLDGIADVQDPDDDGDGVRDLDEIACGTDSLDAGSKPANLDSCAIDTDGDKVPDYRDAFPNDASETKDTDGDGTGDNADIDADGDKISDSEEILRGTNPLVTDSDGDGTADNLDPFPSSSVQAVTQSNSVRKPINVQLAIPGCKKAKRVIAGEFSIIPGQYQLALGDGLEMFGTYQTLKADKKYLLAPSAASTALLQADLDSWADGVCGADVTISSISYTKNELVVTKNQGVINVKTQVIALVNGKSKKGSYAFQMKLPLDGVTLP